MGPGLRACWQGGEHPIMIDKVANIYYSTAYILSLRKLNTTFITASRLRHFMAGKWGALEVYLTSATI